MGDLIIKPASSGNLKIQSDSATNVLTVGTDDSVTLGTEFKVTSTSQTFTVKGIDAAITDSQTGGGDAAADTADSDSGQLAIYNGSTKLWGITEHGYVVNPTLPSFVAHVNSGTAYTSTSGMLPANETNHNQGNHYSTSTYAFTAPINGVYLFTFSALHNNTGSTSRPMFYVNGGTAFNSIRHGISNVDSNGSNSNVTSCLIKLVAGDYVQVGPSSGNIYYYNGAHSSFSGCLIG